ncbi:hypothetical protein WGC32_10740 [Zongyangia sp. HA2173]|uniref:hypothetical protein n=1 Tax=Zongyangia sp. HA2173 TaxID=3133035 RepID=UPI0031632801
MNFLIRWGEADYFLALGQKKSDSLRLSAFAFSLLARKNNHTLTPFNFCVIIQNFFVNVNPHEILKKKQENYEIFSNYSFTKD